MRDAHFLQAAANQKQQGHAQAGHCKRRDRRGGKKGSMPMRMEKKVKKSPGIKYSLAE